VLSTNLKVTRLMLRNLTSADVGKKYLEWLKSPSITRYLEVRFQEVSLKSIRDFVAFTNESPDSILYGIFLANSNTHIGNIKIGPINFQHRRADIGLMIGDKEQWRKGYAREAISIVSDFGFRHLGLEKLTAGCYEENIGSLKAFLSAGFVQDACLPNHWELDGKRQSEVLLGLTKSDYLKSVNKKPVTFRNVESLTFIGGGDLMVSSALHAKNLGYRVGAILAARHAEEILSGGQSTVNTLRSNGIEVVVLQDINVWDQWDRFNYAGFTSLALCFGSAWIFSSEVVGRFGAGMVNFNGVPAPEYLGGAHYSWQVLHENRKGGCFLQWIGDRVDRGDILRYKLFDLPTTVRIPTDYFAANHEIGLRFMEQVLVDMRNGNNFDRISFESIDSQRLFFPRLFTRENAYIDWRWDGDEIERFCNAFDTPYIGAATFWRSQEIRLSKVKFEKRAEPFHPFTSGLIVRRQFGRIWVAAKDGLLELGAARSATGESILEKMREGERISTPQEQLQKSLAFSAKFGGNGISA
jgi:RimJ/RimL family protein N-acetyltransferase/methionyl-tRNA formyltransferase